MAVTFKVPKSPKRNIAASDTFMGVDLTNTGVNIDGMRSPNAPNMVRHVPGKVRKRMGYFKEVLFGTDDDVNFAAGTSAQEKQIHVDSESTSTWIKIYDLIQTISSDAAYTLYLEFDYKSEEDFNIINASTIVTASEDWEHISTSVECLSTDTFSDVKVFSEDAQNIYIKNFALLKTRTESYEWSPAPKYFVERETNDPIYGCHFLKNGTDGFDGDRVVNVNRVLETSDEWKEVSIDTTAVGTQEIIYRMAELPCRTQRVHIEFDYATILPDPTKSGLINIWFCGCETGALLEETSLSHYSGDFTVSDTASTLAITMYYSPYAERFTATFKIKNFSICYEVDENYTWSPAPEDNKEKFHLKDMYNIAPKDYALAESYTKETASITAGSSRTETFEVCDENSHTEGYQYISFDITTSLVNTSASVSQIWVSVLDDVSRTCFIIGKQDENFKKQHIDLFTYCGSTGYLENIEVIIYVTGANTKANISISNIHVKSFTIRDSFVISSKWFLYHVGKEFYLRAHDSSQFTSVYQDANEHISQSFQINDSACLIDGKEIYQFTIKDGEQLSIIDQENAYIPVVTIAKEPNGGGQSYYPFNLLQPGFYEQFIGKASVTDYHLSVDDLDDTECKAWVLDSNGNWNPKSEITDFTVNRDTGVVHFLTAPGATPITGQDSVKILAYKTIDDYRDRVTKCQFGTLFGVSGACDRIFLSGNPEHPNWDFYSQYNDATYFPDTGYSTLGSAQSAIAGYAIVSNYLATFKDGFDQSQSVFIREGDLLEVEEGMPEEPVFRLINTLQGEGALSPYSFGYMQTEPVFLTKGGIYAITEQDITGEKYSQDRSFYLDGQLRKEPNQNKAISTIYDDQYILLLNNQFYILDGLQATRTDKSEPYATRQYAGFYCTNIPASIIWTDDQLCFGTSDGKVCRFYDDPEALESYNDDGKPIYCCWETPDLDGQLFYKNKTFRYFAVRIMKAIKTSVKMYSRKLGIWTMNNESEWTFIKEQTAIGNMLDFNDMDFNLLSFSADMTERVVHTKLRVKKVDKARFKVENGELNQPFGLSDLALEYIESGNYKG